MVLRILKSNRAVNFILIPLLGGIFWLESLFNPGKYPFFRGEAGNLLYRPVDRFLGDAVLWQTLTALVLVIILAFFILQINNRYAFIRIRTMLPAPLFIIMISGLTEMHTLHPVLFASLFFLGAIYRFFDTFDKVKPYSALFDSSILLGMASLFYFNSIVLFPALFIGTGILTRETRWREYVIVITGFVLPFIFAFSYAFFTETTLELLKIFEMNVLTPNNHFKENVLLPVYLGVLVLLTFLGSIRIIEQYDSKKVSTRKFFSVFFLFFIFSLTGFTFVPAISQEMLVITAIPVTFLVSNFFVFMKSRFWGELLFSFLLICVIIMQLLG